MSPEDRARAVVAYFPTIPEKVRPQLEQVIARAIKRALMEQLAQLESLAERKGRMAEGSGKQRKGHHPWAIHFHGKWEEMFRDFRRRVQ